MHQSNYRNKPKKELHESEANYNNSRSNRYHNEERGRNKEHYLPVDYSNNVNNINSTDIPNWDDMNEDDGRDIDYIKSNADDEINVDDFYITEDVEVKDNNHNDEIQDIEHTNHYNQENSHNHNNNNRHYRDNRDKYYRHDKHNNYYHENKNRNRDNRHFRHHNNNHKNNNNINPDFNTDQNTHQFIGKKKKKIEIEVIPYQPSKQEIEKEKRFADFMSQINIGEPDLLKVFSKTQNENNDIVLKEMCILNIKETRVKKVINEFTHYHYVPFRYLSPEVINKLSNIEESYVLDEYKNNTFQENALLKNFKNGNLIIIEEVRLNMKLSSSNNTDNSKNNISNKEALLNAGIYGNKDYKDNKDKENDNNDKNIDDAFADYKTSLLNQTKKYLMVNYLYSCINHKKGLVLLELSEMLLKAIDKSVEENIYLELCKKDKEKVTKEETIVIEESKDDKELVNITVKGCKGCESKNKNLNILHNRLFQKDQDFEDYKKEMEILTDKKNKLTETNEEILKNEIEKNKIITSKRYKNMCLFLNKSDKEIQDTINKKLTIEKHKTKLFQKENSNLKEAIMIMKEQMQRLSINSDNNSNANTNTSSNINNLYSFLQSRRCSSGKGVYNSSSLLICRDSLLHSFTIKSAKDIGNNNYFTIIEKKDNCDNDDDLSGINSDIPIKCLFCYENDIDKQILFDCNHESSTCLKCFHENAAFNKQHRKVYGMSCPTCGSGFTNSYPVLKGRKNK